MDGQTVMVSESYGISGPTGRDRSMLTLFQRGQLFLPVVFLLKEKALPPGTLTCPTPALHPVSPLVVCRREAALLILMQPGASSKGGHGPGVSCSSWVWDECLLGDEGKHLPEGHRFPCKHGVFHQAPEPHAPHLLVNRLFLPI